ncbi:hypothetical protein CQA01_17530 [Cyclobacterium qasimii]|uniref:Lipocalin-like domain-containing protein n=3 Tax=Cyclobacterium qasimii TaxID=1350429 RepID=A0A512CAI1_9BACT|nr:hypothetical protein CQA01_17530 [Cyclobacterium qasimii]
MSCVEEEVIEAQNLYGNWENFIYLENQDLNKVDTYVFDLNGKYYRSIAFKNPETNQTLGYSMYLTGNYILEGNELVLNEESRLFNLGEDLYEDIDGLSEIDVVENTTVSLAFKSSRQILEITKTCSPLLSSICIPVTAYNRREYALFSPQ